MDIHQDSIVCYAWMAETQNWGRQLYKSVGVFWKFDPAIQMKNSEILLNNPENIFNPILGTEYVTENSIKNF